MNRTQPRTSGASRAQSARRPSSGTSNAKQHYEKYLIRAREAQLAGDVVEMENCYQHAEHYLRVMRAVGAA